MTQASITRSWVFWGSLSLVPVDYVVWKKLLLLSKSYKLRSVNTVADCTNKACWCCHSCHCQLKINDPLFHLVCKTLHTLQNVFRVLPLAKSSAARLLLRYQYAWPLRSCSRSLLQLQWLCAQKPPHTKHKCSAWCKLCKTPAWWYCSISFLLCFRTAPDW